MLEVLDTAGQEEYSALREQWIRDGDAFLLVYSITTRKSFEAVRSLRRQIQQVKQFPMDATFPIILVGNKCDLASDRDVSTKEGEVSAKDMQVGFLETSAKEATNVEEAYYEAVRRVRKQQNSLDRAISPYAETKSQYSQSKMGGRWKTRITKLFKSDK
jgi:GTPase KRas